MRKGRLIVIDGIAGSGKSTIIREIKKWILAQNLSVFDLTDWSKENIDAPLFENVSEKDVYLLFEPTKTWIGRSIRYEMGMRSELYTGQDLAEALALDRFVMYQRVVIPALEAGKIVIQDRSVSTSIVYQPVMKHGPTVEEVLSLRGNALAMQYAPDLLLLTDISIQAITERFNTREDEAKGIFQDIELLKKCRDRYHSDWYRELFEKVNTRVKTISTEGSVDETIQQTIEIISPYFSQTYAR